jgi:hypothetical protein
MQYAVLKYIDKGGAAVAGEELRIRAGCSVG